MNENVFNWAFIGAGGIAHSVAKRIVTSGRHKIAAVYNRTHSRALQKSSVGVCTTAWKPR